MGYQFTEVYVQHGEIRRANIPDPTACIRRGIDVKKLNTAAENEQEHINVLRKRIMELQGNPSHTGFLFQTSGRILGRIAGIFGKEFVLKVDVFFENRAIRDYGTFLNTVKFDEDTVQLINRIIADEVFHTDTWKSSIEELAVQEV